jgi:hypothetical protein
MKNFLLVLIFLSHALFAQQAVEGEVELAGFVLGQYRRTVHAQLGAPIEKRVTSEGWIYEFHKLKPDTSVYALFKYPKWDTTRIYSIQLNGEKFEEMKPFRGLKLGAPKDMVHSTFGKSSRTEIVEDPPLIIEYYDHHNYSFDIDKETGTLYGIQIYGRILEQKPQVPAPSLAPFRNAVLSKNEDSLISTVAPDVEFYKDGKVVSYKMGVRKEFSDKTSDLVKFILGDANSLLYVFATEKAADVPEQRVYNKSNDVTTVYKFPSSKVLDEIVFIPHAGQWKVYEVRFK